MLCPICNRSRAKRSVVVNGILKKYCSGCIRRLQKAAALERTKLALANGRKPVESVGQPSNATDLEV